MPLLSDITNQPLDNTMFELITWRQLANTAVFRSNSLHRLRATCNRHSARQSNQTLLATVHDSKLEVSQRIATSHGLGTTMNHGSSSGLSSDECVVDESDDSIDKSIFDYGAGRKATSTTLSGSETDYLGRNVWMCSSLGIKVCCVSATKRLKVSLTA
jgi:hypothetical protein